MKLLVGVGGSDNSVRALQRAIERAEEAGDELTVVIVEDPDSTPDPGAVRERVEAVLSEASFEAEIRTPSGHPGSTLLEISEREGFDRIVIGGGERSPLGKVRLGSIAEFVLLNATTTVTLIR